VDYICAELSSTENVQQNFESAAKPDEGVYPNRIGRVNHFCAALPRSGKQC
jgi:hypothetical protein